MPALQKSSRQRLLQRLHAQPGPRTAQACTEIVREPFVSAWGGWSWRCHVSTRSKVRHCGTRKFRLKRPFVTRTLPPVSRILELHGFGRRKVKPLCGERMGRAGKTITETVSNMTIFG